MATAPIQSLAWESPYAMGMALKKTKKKGGGEKEKDTGMTREREDKIRKDFKTDIVNMLKDLKENINIMRIEIEKSSK